MLNECNLIERINREEYTVIFPMTNLETEAAYISIIITIIRKSIKTN